MPPWLTRQAKSENPEPRFCANLNGWTSDKQMDLQGVLNGNAAAA